MEGETSFRPPHPWPLSKPNQESRAAARGWQPLSFAWMSSGGTVSPVAEVTVVAVWPCPLEADQGMACERTCDLHSWNCPACGLWAGVLYWSRHFATGFAEVTWPEGRPPEQAGLSLASSGSHSWHLGDILGDTRQLVGWAAALWIEYQGLRLTLEKWLCRIEKEMACLYSLFLEAQNALKQTSSPKRGPVWGHVSDVLPG